MSPWGQPLMSALRAASACSSLTPVDQWAALLQAGGPGAKAQGCGDDVQNAGGDVTLIRPPARRFMNLGLVTTTREQIRQCGGTVKGFLRRNTRVLQLLVATFHFRWGCSRSEYLPNKPSRSSSLSFC